MQHIKATRVATASWKITKDFIDTDAVGVGDFNPGDEMPFKFRMYDDDGELYYEGVSSDNETEDAFLPLDDFGMPNAGCTDIKYLTGGHWESL